MEIARWKLNNLTPIHNKVKVSSSTKPNNPANALSVIKNSKIPRRFPNTYTFTSRRKNDNNLRYNRMVSFNTHCSHTSQQVQIMTLIKTGGGVTDIRGPYGGTYFTRDRSGLHLTAKPRRVKQLSPAQSKQRNAFIKARTYTQDPRWVSYYIYKALNNLPFIFDAIVTGEVEPDCTGKYTLAGTHNDKDYYSLNNIWVIWWNSEHNFWSIENIQLFPPIGYWRRDAGIISGPYLPIDTYTGTAKVKLQLRPPPVDYYISTLQPPPEE